MATIGRRRWLSFKRLGTPSVLSWIVRLPQIVPYSFLELTMKPQKERFLIYQERPQLANMLRIEFNCAQLAVSCRYINNVYRLEIGIFSRLC